MQGEINGKIEDYGDSLMTSVACTFGWRDRIRILFGKSAHVSVRSYTKDVIVLVGTETDLRVDPIVIYTYPPEKLKPIAVGEIPTCYTNAPLNRITF